jgi:adenosylhomocysteinase
LLPGSRGGMWSVIGPCSPVVTRPASGFTSQTLAQIELHKNAESYGKTVTVLSKELDEKVARLHLAKFGVNLMTLTKEQTDYINVKVEGPYKPGHYRT